MKAQFLIHSDALGEAVTACSGPSINLFNAAEQNTIRLWVLSTTLSEVRKNLNPNEMIQWKKWLSILKVLSLTSLEIKEAMASSNNSDLILIQKAVTEFNLQAVLTLQPQRFKKLSIPAALPSGLKSLLEKINPTPISLVSPPASYHEIWDDLEDSIANVIRPGLFVLGSKVSELEEKIASYCQTRHAIGVSSGTDALLIALMAEDISRNDEVITTPFTFFATVGSISRLGAKPVFVDIDPQSFNISPEAIEEKITSQTKAIIPVHLYGQCSDMDPILKIAEKFNLTVIEDAAQAIGSEYKFKRAGSFGRYGCFSFFPTKNLGGFGDGGIITTSSDEAAEKLRLLRVHGSKIKYRHEILGGNFRLDALQAAVVSAKLTYLEGWTEKRRQISKNYRQLIKKNNLDKRLQTPKEIFPRHVYNQFVVRVHEQRGELMKFLKTRGIATEIYYPVALHEQECFAHLGYRRGDFPEAEKAAAESLALPIAHEISLEQQSLIISAIADYFS
tara:strand:- start:7767 stop:9278 length:1512 start_codon:yes stop_codon:yes gene_type:complete